MAIRRKLPSSFYKPHECELVIELWKRGFTNNQIAHAMTHEFPDDQGKATFKYATKVHNARRKVANILKDPENWNPDMDESMIQRAFNCDLDAYDQLTHFERKELFDRLYEVYKVKSPHPLFPECGSDWMGAWTDAVNEDRKCLATRMSQRKRVQNLKLPKVRKDGSPVTDALMRKVATEYRAGNISQKALGAKYNLSHMSIQAIVHVYELD